jgi:hypothetical protein
MNFNTIAGNVTIQKKSEISSIKLAISVVSYGAEP